MTSMPSGFVGDLEEIRRRGRLRVLTIPFHRVPDAYQVNSFDLEIVQRFVNAEKLGLEEALVGSYEEIIPALLAGRGDVAAGGLTVTEERKRRVAFTSETFPSRMVVVTRRPRPPILDARQLAKERLGTERGTSCAEITRSPSLPTASTTRSASRTCRGRSRRGGSRPRCSSCTCCCPPSATTRTCRLACRWERRGRWPSRCARRALRCWRRSTRSYTRSAAATSGPSCRSSSSGP